MLENKTVSIKDPGILQFFYPEFILSESLPKISDRSKSIIYTGGYKRNLLDTLKKNTKKFINTAGSFDINLNDRDKMLDFVFSKHTNRVKKSVKETVEYLDDKDFLNCCKVYWVSGEWVYDDVEEERNLFHFFLSAVDSRTDIISVYFNLSKKYPFYVLESSFFTFIQKSLSYEDQAVSDGYFKVLKKFYNKYGKDRIKKSVRDYAFNDWINNEELKFIQFIMKFNA